MHTEETRTDAAVQDAAQAPQPKAAYRAPQLVELGDVRELTRGGGFTTKDFLTTRRKGT
jgi:hypothetical protein